MEFMKNVMLTACILSVILTIAGHMKSGEKFSRQLNIIFSLVFISGVLASALKTGFDFNLSDYSIEAYEEEYTVMEENAMGAVENEAELRINNVIENLLRKNDVSFEKISSDININEDGSISINRIDYKGDDFEKAEDLIKNNLDVEEVIGSE